MKIILNENLENLGSVGDVVNVKDGYARNYLIPRGMAVIATPSNVKVVEQAKAKEIEKEKERRAEAQEFAKKIRGISLVYEAAAGDEGKLYGSVTAAQIQELLAAQGIEVDRKNVLVTKPIRKIGAYEIDVRVYTNVKAPVKLSVVEKKDEKKAAKAEKSAKAEKAGENAETSEGTEAKPDEAAEEAPAPGGEPETKSEEKGKKKAKKTEETGKESG